MYGQQYRAPASTSQASYDSALAFLKQLNTKELQDLMDDNNRLNKMVDELEIVKTQQVEKETALASNKSIAEYNLSREPRLIQARQQLADVYEQAVKLQKEFERKKLEMDSNTNNTSLDVSLALLQTEAAKSEEESEACAESFLSKQMNLDDFITKYIALRTQAHLRKVKADKMAEIVRDQERQRSAAPVGALRPAPVPPSSYSSGAANGWGGSSAPYPINPVNFPTPSYRL